jgi:hypothetical protein
MKLKSFHFIGTVFALCLYSSIATAQIKPYFGYSGVYPGTIKYKGKQIAAKLELVQFGDVIRGFINTEIVFNDDSGNEWKGTSIFLKGHVSEGNKILARVTDHQCAAIASICTLEKKLSEDSATGIVEVIQEGPDYVLYKVSFSSLPQSFPFTSAEFVMDSTYAAIEPNSANSFYGIWDLIGYGADALVYPTASPVFNINLTLFQIDGRDRTNIFMNTGDRWYPANDLLALRSSDSQQNLASLRWMWWNYDLRFSSGYVFGLIRNHSQVNEEIDFEGILWGFSDAGLQSAKRSLRK